MIKSKIKPLFDTISSSVLNIGNENLSGLCSEAGNLLENLSEENCELKKENQKLTWCLTKVVEKSEITPIYNLSFNIFILIYEFKFSYFLLSKYKMLLIRY